MTARSSGRRGAGSSVLGCLLLLLLPPPLGAQVAGPRDVLTRDQLLRTGRSGLAELLQSLLPSVNVPHPSVAGGTDHVRPVSLHGLGADQIVVLINGQRRHRSALLNLDETLGRGQGMVDFDAIPLSAIERIEVLRDGAAARYGFGAVAGVINIVLVERSSRNQLVAELGTTTQGDGGLLRAGGHYGLTLSGQGFLQVGGELAHAGATNRALPDRRAQYFPGDPRNGEPALSDRVDSRFGAAESDGVSGFVNGEQPVGSGISAYGFGSWSRRRGEAGEHWRTASDDRTVRAIFPTGYLPLIAPSLQDGSAVAGLRGTLLGWRWDASLGYGRNSARWDIRNSLNASLGAESPTRFSAGTLRADQFLLELGLSRRVTPGKRLPPLLIELGGFRDSDGYQVQAGEPDSYRYGARPILDGPHAGAVPDLGVQGFTAVRPSNEVTARRGRIGGLAELSTVVLQRLRLAAAGRVEHYDEFGDLGVYRVSGALTPFGGLELHAAYGTGVRVPSLAQAWFSSDVTVVMGVFGFEDRLVRPADPVALALGVPTLRPEHSTDLSLGGTISRKGLRLAADYYRVRVRDRIILSGRFDDPSVSNYLAGQQLFGIAAVRFFANALATRSAGVDAAADYQVAARGATLRVGAAWHHGTMRVALTDSVRGVLTPFNGVFFARTERTRLEQGQPEDNVIVSARAERSRWDADVRVQRAGPVSSAGAPADGSLDQRYRAQWTADLRLSYRTGRGITLMLGADNLFDSYPERNRFGDAAHAGNSDFGMFPYSNLAPLGFAGRFLYLRAVWRS